jgi:hypothetical protein
MNNLGSLLTSALEAYRIGLVYRKTRTSGRSLARLCAWMSYDTLQRVLSSRLPWSRRLWDGFVARLVHEGDYVVLDDREPIDQEGSVHDLNDMPVMLSHRLVDDLVMRLQQPQHTRFIGAHLAAKAYDVREHDGGQAAALASYGTRAVLGHRGDYHARSLRLSNVPANVFLALASPKE